MSPNWPKLASLAQTTSHFNCFKFCECVYCSQSHSSQNLLSRLFFICPRKCMSCKLIGGTWDRIYQSKYKTILSLRLDKTRSKTRLAPEIKLISKKICESGPNRFNTTHIVILVRWSFSGLVQIIHTTNTGGVCRTPLGITVAVELGSSRITIGITCKITIIVHFTTATIINQPIGNCRRTSWGRSGSCNKLKKCKINTVLRGLDTLPREAYLTKWFFPLLKRILL